MRFILAFRETTKEQCCFLHTCRSRCMLGTFFALLVVVFVAEVAGGIVAYLNKEQLVKRNFISQTKDICNSQNRNIRPHISHPADIHKYFFPCFRHAKSIPCMYLFCIHTQSKTFIETGFSEIVKNEYGRGGFDARTQYFDVVQSELECCGAKSSWDWFQSSWRGGSGDLGSNGTETYLVPLSCCKKQYRLTDPRCVATGDNVGVPQNLINSNTDIINERVRVLSQLSHDYITLFSYINPTDFPFPFFCITSDSLAVLVF